MMASAARRRCLGAAGNPCAVRIRAGSRCPACAKAHEQRRETNRAATRQTNEPWRALYTMKPWRHARAVRLNIDGNTCTDCRSTRNLSVDHTTPLRTLWEHWVGTHGDHHGFVGAACDIDHLRTRCASCHGTIEAQRRKQA